MPGLTQETTSVLPSALEAFIGAVLAHPEMQAEVSRGHRHPTLWNIWDFAMRTKYILSELDNIEAGRAVQYPQQIPDYEFSANPAPEKVREHMRDVFTRSVSLREMVTGDGATLMMMGLPPMDIGEEIRNKAKALDDSFEGIERF